MPDQSLYTFTQIRVAVGYYSRRCGAQIGDRLRREQTGQDVLEYAGMIVLVAAVIVLLFTLNVPTTIGNAIGNAINAIVSNGKTSYSAPPPITVKTG